MKKTILSALVLSFLSISYAEKQENLILPSIDQGKYFPISRYFVDDLFNKIAIACSNNDKSALFEQFSKEIRNKLLQENENNTSERFLNICAVVAKTRKEIELDNPQKTSQFGIELESVTNTYPALCSYKKNETIDECSKITRITIENNMLKINER